MPNRPLLLFVSQDLVVDAVGLEPTTRHLKDVSSPSELRAHEEDDTTRKAEFLHSLRR